MSSLRQDEPAYPESSESVAVQPASDGAPLRAHAIAPAMAKLGPLGVTRCGFPIEHLVVVPDLDWADVTPDQQCQHCAPDRGP
jgi:hypothetical protein